MLRSGLDIDHVCKVVDENRCTISRTKGCTCQVRLDDPHKLERMKIVAKTGSLCLAL